ncbi:MAG: type II 3-dehydroquinate dehydratase [Phycisphaerales bacterium]|nr:type II 3-dehydroquinate dehydratase [Phycisphaerales bacterium]
MHIAIVNGPNLNLLGVREPSIYGTESFDSYFLKLSALYPQIVLAHHQSNIEGELVNIIQDIAVKVNGIILNAAAYTHTSIAIRDCLAMVHCPIIEVHLSNIYAREDFRCKNLLADKCKGSICGLGLKGYELALQYLISL